jgi:hypothetical protein
MPTKQRKKEDTVGQFDMACYRWWLTGKQGM